jgi:hypothetical protein
MTDSSITEVEGRLYDASVEKLIGVDDEIVLRLLGR